MSQENVEGIKQAAAAVNERDIRPLPRWLYGGHRVADALRPHRRCLPRGPEGIRRFFADIQDTSPDFRLEPRTRGGDDGGQAQRVNPKTLSEVRTP